MSIIDENQCKIEDNPHIKQVLIYPNSYKINKDIPYKRIIDDEMGLLEYKPKKDEVKSVIHWGQRKLLLSEIEFLTKYGHLSNEVVYVGAAPGTHMPQLARMFPKHHFTLIDPSVFNIKASEIFDIRNVLFTKKETKEFKGRNILFISDIRAGNRSDITEKEFEQQVLKDMLMQQDWVLAMKPAKSMLKFRFPFFPGKTEYLDGDVYLPIWGPVSTTECRLITSGDKKRIYDHTEHEQRLFWFNTCMRANCYNHEYHGEGIDHCYDCTAEVNILHDYLISTTKITSINVLKIKIADLVKNISRSLGKRTLKSANSDPEERAAYLKSRFSKYWKKIGGTTELEKFLDAYKITKSPELEIKIYLDKPTWLKFYNSFKNEKKECIISIQQFSKGMRKEIFLYPKKVEFLKKDKVSEIIYRDYKIVLATELHSEEISKHPFKTFNLIRLKRRATIVVGNWKLDFTISKQFSEDDSWQIHNAENKKFLEVNNDFYQECATCRHELEVEYIGKNPPTQTDLDSIINILPNKKENISNYNDKLNIISELLNPNKPVQNFKKLVNNPKSFSLTIYGDIYENIDKYYIADKTDGKRGLLIYGSVNFIITGKNVIDMNDVDIFKKFPKTKDTILDIELIDEAAKKYVAFDILMFNNRNITSLPFEERWKFLKPLAKNGISIKNMVRLSKATFRESLKTVFNSETVYQKDGLIFTPATENYYKMQVYKWKPPILNTIDFLMLKAPDTLKSNAPFDKLKGNLYLLCNGISRHEYNSLTLNTPNFIDTKTLFKNIILYKSEYFPILFTPASNNLAYIYCSPDLDNSDKHMKIGEFGYEYDPLTKNGIVNWQFHRIRSDKQIDLESGKLFGNDFHVAESEFDLVKTNFTFEKLLDPPTVYFKKEKEGEFKKVAKYNNFVKFQVFNELNRSSYNAVIDIASGKGQDLFLYNSLHIAKGIFIDQDVDALAELAKRRYHLKDEKYYAHWLPKPTMDFSMEVNTIHSNILTIGDKIKNTGIQKVDLIVMQFAIHYITNNITNITKLCEIVKSHINGGGVFIFSCFNGAKIEELLKSLKKGETWNEGPYSITKKYDDTPKPSPYGKLIAVKHPFSKNEYYDEYLAYPKAISRQFEKTGFKQILDKSFIDYYDNYGYEIPEVDKKYIDLYHIIVLEKRKNGK